MVCWVALAGQAGAEAKGACSAAQLGADGHCGFRYGGLYGTVPPTGPPVVCNEHLKAVRSCARLMQRDRANVRICNDVLAAAFGTGDSWTCELDDVRTQGARHTVGLASMCAAPLTGGPAVAGSGGAPAPAAPGRTPADAAALLLMDQQGHQTSLQIDAALNRATAARQGMFNVLLSQGPAQPDAGIFATLERVRLLALWHLPQALATSDPLLPAAWQELDSAQIQLVQCRVFMKELQDRKMQLMCGGRPPPQQHRRPQRRAAAFSEATGVLLAAARLSGHLSDASSGCTDSDGEEGDLDFAPESCSTVGVSDVGSIVGDNPDALEEECLLLAQDRDARPLLEHVQDGMMLAHGE